MVDEDDTEWQELPADGFIGLVGPFFAGPSDANTARFRFRAEPKHKNRRGVVQGGMIMTFADRALGTAARRNDPTVRQATVQLDVHFIDAVEIGETVEIACTILRRTRTLIFMDGIMTVGERMVATARGTWKLLRPANPD
jgi:uncharacterized protein (TIGR00369 family)